MNTEQGQNNRSSNSFHNAHLLTMDISTLYESYPSINANIINQKTAYRAAYVIIHVIDITIELYFDGSIFQPLIPYYTCIYITSRAI